MRLPVFIGTWPDPSIGLPELDQATFAGISVAITGNVLISLALNCQKLAHRRLEREREVKNETAKHHYNATNHSPGVPPFTSPPEDDSHDGTSSAMPSATESDPLLPRHSEVPYGADAGRQRPNVKGRWRIFSMFHRNPAVDASRKADAELGSAIHALVPVDVVAVSSSSGTEGSLGKGQSTEQSNQHESETDYLKSKLWWFGFLLMNIGEVGNFISYAFAPASVVAPLGTFALIANCLFAPVILGERFRKLDVFGILLAILGAITVVLSANPSNVRLDPPGLLKAISQHSFIAYATIYVVGAIVLSTLSEGLLGRRWVYIDIGLCAIFGGFTVLSTKAISTLLTMEWFEIFTEWITYPIIAILVGTGVGQIRYLNRALMRFDSKIVVPTQFVFFNLSAIIGSAILYGDFRRATFHQIVTFLYGCGTTFLGVFIITWTQQTSADEVGGGDQEGTVDVEDGTRPSRDVRLGSLARRNRATLVIPEGVVSAAATPILRNKQSMVSMIGLSPAQRLLIISSSPHDDGPRFDYERDVLSTPDSISRRRTVSWMGDDAATRNNSRGISSHANTRENSRIRSIGQVANEPSTS